MARDNSVQDEIILSFDRIDLESGGILDLDRQSIWLLSNFSP
ncbi:unnamed protein product [Acidithrix sp. C25]|nr:unnamed protein product [Acidithrix sp. C25]